MRKIERKNTGLLVTSSTISKIGDTLFDYVNNSFLASMNVKSMVLVGVYQNKHLKMSLEPCLIYLVE